MAVELNESNDTTGFFYLIYSGYGQYLGCLVSVMACLPLILSFLSTFSSLSTIYVVFFSLYILFYSEFLCADRSGGLLSISYVFYDALLLNMKSLIYSLIILFCCSSMSGDLPMSIISVSMAILRSLRGVSWCFMRGRDRGTNILSELDLSYWLFTYY